ncbi:MAG: PQQ-dependent sugar dehydrogenase [Flavobacteriales bacterium]|nr:PQQ-dependent sugar dehydrogenase [Flavobacteriales bacterium]MCB9167899.1 PQQ-dependent sugar dehydrogenase [Flavobacteriales bacterium]
MKRHPLLFLTALAVAGPGKAQNNVQVQLVPWANGFTRPVDIAECGDDRLFIVEQAGRIKIITDSMVVQATPFLDITAQVNDLQNEQGLLGMAFDPDYVNNGFFYVYYITGSGSGTSRIARFSVSADSSLADPNSEVVLYTWPQPYTNHNGGDLSFGPDGYLYCGFGDGGSGGDPQNHAQTLSDPLGCMIRIRPEVDSTYSIPPDNPYVNAGADTLPEIWANGLRNPWRFGFDRSTGDLWIGDVGQNAHEEVDFWPVGDNSGPNFGWRCYEGDATYNTSGCQGMGAYVFPVTTHDNVAIGGTWCSSVGGRVYRGSQYPHLYGRYFYTDYCASEIWNIWPDGQGGWNDAQAGTSATGYVCIAEGMDGTLYLSNEVSGQVRKLVDKCPMDPPSISNDGFMLTSSPANSYQWYGPGGLILGATQQTYTPTVGGDYAVLANFGNGCVFLSDTTTFIATLVSGSGAVQGVVLYPVPANDRLVIRLEAPISSGRLLLTDLTGRVVRERTIAGSGHIAIDVSDVPEGAYFVHVENGIGNVIWQGTLPIVH